VRILVISNLFPPVVRGGYEVLCAETVKRLRERHDVVVLTSRCGEAPFEPGVMRELEYVGHGKRAALRAPLAAVRAARVMRRLLDSFEPELVFVWNAVGIPQAAVRVAEVSGVPVAYSVAEHWFARLHAADPFMRYLAPGQRGARRLWSLFIRACNHHPQLRLETGRKVRASICWISHALRNGTKLPATVEPDLERVIYVGVHEPARWTTLERRPASDPPTLAFVGRLEEQKGPSVAYRALAALKERHGIDARLKLAGRGTPPEIIALHELARDLGISDRVELLGQLEQSEVAELLAEASAIVVPSTWEEPAGCVCLEAGLARVPVVASRSGGMPDGLLEEQHALYFPIGDADACADALARVLTEPEETRARVRRAFERARQFGFEGYMAQMSEFVDAAAGRPHADPGDDSAVARSHLRRGLGSGSAARSQPQQRVWS
jgi:glycosyltransferase involved in cell wall biosynthesis